MNNLASIANAKLMRALRAASDFLSTRVLPVRHPHGSMRGKIMGVVLITTVSALLVAGITLLTHDLNNYRQSWAADLSTEAGILALSTAPALQFDDHKVALQNLSALQAHSAILSAALYLPDGSLYADYEKSGEAPPPQQLTSVSAITQVSGEHIEVIQPILRKGERLGTIYLRARYDVKGRIEAYLGIFAIVTFIAMVVALILTSTLQRVITDPLDAISEASQQIIKGSDYSPRAWKRSDDEFGVVVEAFNKMLDEVQTRTHSLEQSNSALKNEVITRQAAETALAQANTRLESTMAAAEIGSWVWDAQSQQYICDRNLAALYGFDGQQEIRGDLSLFAKYIHPDDLPAMMDRQSQPIQIDINPSTEFRIVRPDGSIKYLLTRSKAQLDEFGVPRLVAGLIIDISPQKVAEQKLRDADRRKDEFLATLAHELRNPLAPILQALKILASPMVAQSQQLLARDVIARQVNHMILLLDDLLDVSRITQGRLELRKTAVALESLIATAIETSRPFIDSKHHTLKTILPAEPVMLEVDSLRLGEAITNLLTNAAKYTDAGGDITLAVAIGASELSIAVKDTGIGMSATFIPKVFDMFSQIESALDRSEGGLGIGLALVKGMVALHGGRVEATSAGEGLGSCFTIYLPNTCITTAATAPSVASAIVQPSIKPDHHKILVVDDNRDAAECLALVLELSGHEVLVAHSGRQAINLGMSEHPHVVILDIGMPDMNGYEVAEYIRQQSWGKSIVMIAVSGWGQHDDKEKARRAGFNHHFTKPVNSDELEQWLANYDAEQIASGNVSHVIE